MAPSDRPSTRAQRTKADLKAAIHFEIARSGTLDVAAVTEAAGLSQATFYSHFGSHDDALAAALDISLTNVTEVSRSIVNIETILEMGLADMIDLLVEQLVVAFGVEAPVLRVALARLSQNTTIRDVYRSHQSAHHLHLTKQLELGQRASVVRAGEPDQLAAALLVSAQGLNNPLLLRTDGNDETMSALKRALLAILKPDATS